MRFNKPDGCHYGASHYTVYPLLLRVGSPIHVRVVVITTIVVVQFIVIVRVHFILLRKNISVVVCHA